MLSIQKRKNILKKLKGELRVLFGKNLISATIYGSTLTGDFCEFSDFDILLIFKKITGKELSLIRNLKRKYREENLDLDINLHEYGELPCSRQELFIHNNRSLYMQKEICLYGKQLIGKNLFKNQKLDSDQLKIESVKIIHSFHYNVRKLLTKTENSEYDVRQGVKFCLYATLYALAYFDIYPKNKIEAYHLFERKFKIHVRDLQKLKMNPTFGKNRGDLRKAFVFLGSLDKKIFSYHNKAHGHNHPNVGQFRKYTY